eukprot:COSAG02_NODE_5596_length_4200_cov_4.631553_3_plen_298_part_00
MKQTYEKAVAGRHVGRARKSLTKILQEQQQLALVEGTRPREPVPEPAPRPPPPAATVYQPRKAPKDQDWKELSKRNQKYAEDLGWDQKTWDAGDQAPFETLWTEMDQKKRDAAAALQFNKGMFHHAHDSEDFWETILQVSRDGLVGMNIASTVRRELENVDLLWSHELARDPAEAVRPRLTELLVDLSEYEAWSEDIRNTALSSGLFEDMKNKVRQRDEKANELYPRVEGMLSDLENMCDDLERRCESIRKCQQELAEAGAQMEPADGADAEELLVCDKREMEVRLCHHLRSCLTEG